MNHIFITANTINQKTVVYQLFFEEFVCGIRFEFIFIFKFGTFSARAQHYIKMLNGISEVEQKSLWNLIQEMCNQSHFLVDDACFF